MSRISNTIDNLPNGQLSPQPYTPTNPPNDWLSATWHPRFQEIDVIPPISTEINQLLWSIRQNGGLTIVEQNRLRDCPNTTDRVEALFDLCHRRNADPILERAVRNALWSSASLNYLLREGTRP